MTTTNYASISNQQLLASRVLSGLAALFLLVDGGMKLFKPPVVVEATLKLGYPESAIVGIGIALLAGTLHPAWHRAPFWKGRPSRDHLKASDGSITRDGASSK